MKDGFGREIKVDDVVIACHRSGSSQCMKRYLVIEVEEKRVKAVFDRATPHYWANTKREIVWLRTPSTVVVIYPILETK